MSNTQKCLHNLALLLLSVWMVAGCQTGTSDDGRYFTWVDEQGQVRRSPIPEEQNPVDARAEQIREQQSAAGRNDKAGHAPESETTTAANSNTTETRDAGEPVTRDNAVAQTNQARTRPHKKASGRASAEGSEKARAEFTDSEYNRKNYPDGNELAAKGFLRDGAPLPYFTWRDAQGHMRVSHYRPKGKPTESQRVTENTPQLTSALVLNGKSRQTPEKMDPDVMSVMDLKSTNTILQDWNARCCQNLAVRDSERWQSSREFQVDMTAQTDKFAFSTGESAYQLIQLPSGDESVAFVMRLRSYIHHGVFVPTLVFLDDQLRTRRLVTDLAFKFNPETWHSLGSFQSMVPVFPGQGDRWLLVMSRKEDQEGQTMVEKDGWPTAIPHQAKGTLGIMEVE